MAWKNSVTSAPSGALPETRKRRRPPSFSRMVENTSRSASAASPAMSPAGLARGRARGLRAARPAPPSGTAPPRRGSRWPASRIARLQLLVDPRHTGQDRRPHRPMSRAIVSERFGKDDRDAAQQVDVRHHPFECMAERQERQRHVFLRESSDLRPAACSTRGSRASASRPSARPVVPGRVDDRREIAAATAARVVAELARRRPTRRSCARDRAVRLRRA